MVKMSAMRNCPVICKNKRIGLMQGMYMESDAKQVSALIVACGFRGKRIVQRGDIQSVANGFVLIRNTERAKDLHDCMGSIFVRDTAGLLVGRVTDYAIDENTMQILAVEILTGYLPGVYMKRIWIFNYEYHNPGEFVVPASFGSELMRIKAFKEEEAICDCQQ